MRTFLLCLLISLCFSGCDTRDYFDGDTLNRLGGASSTGNDDPGSATGSLDPCDGHYLNRHDEIQFSYQSNQNKVSIMMQNGELSQFTIQVELFQKPCDRNAYLTETFELAPEEIKNLPLSTYQNICKDCFLKLFINGETQAEFRVGDVIAQRSLPPEKS